MQSQRPAGGDAQCGWHVRAKWAETGSTHRQRVVADDDGDEWQAEDSAAIPRYRVNSNATDVGRQRTTAVGSLGCGMRTDLSICVDSQWPGVYGRLLPLLWIAGQAFHSSKRHLGRC
jgi:hypothetical protein